MLNLCPPAIIYLIFSLTQILIDIFKKLYNTVIVKFIVMIMVTLLLNILCQQGLGVVSWIIVFIPFILMTVVVSAVLYMFGLDAATGKIKRNYNSSYTKCGNGISIDSSGDIIIYDPEYNQGQQVYYNSPNIVVPNPSNNNTKNNTYPSQSLYINSYIYPYNYSSSPAYQS
jgi:hypothetical protein